MCGSQTNVDWLKLEALDRKYKAARGAFRTGERLM